MPPVDLQGTMLRFGFDADLLREMATMYCEDAPERLRQLVAAHDGDDLAGIRFAAHSLKGMGATIGAERVARAAAGVEDLANRGLRSLLIVAVDDLREAVDESLAILSRYETVR